MFKIDLQGVFKTPTCVCMHIKYLLLSILKLKAGRAEYNHYRLDVIF